MEVYGVDLAVIFRKKRWRHLLALIDGLSEGSRYLAAVLSDEEFAEQLLDEEERRSDDEDESKDKGPSLVGYRQMNYQLAEISDGIKALQNTLVAVNGGKAKPPKPTPRPKTKYDEVKRRREEESAQRVADLFSPQN